MISDTLNSFATSDFILKSISKRLFTFILTEIYLYREDIIRNGNKLCPPFAVYEGYSKINLRLVGKNKRVVIASKRTLSSNKEILFLLYAYPHNFSPRSVGVNTDKTWTLSSPLYLTAGGSGDDSVRVLSVFTPTLRGENL